MMRSVAVIKVTTMIMGTGSQGIDSTAEAKAGLATTRTETSMKAGR